MCLRKAAGWIGVERERGVWLAWDKRPMTADAQKSWIVIDLVWTGPLTVDEVKKKWLFHFLYPWSGSWTGFYINIHVTQCLTVKSTLSDMQMSAVLEAMFGERNTRGRSELDGSRTSGVTQAAAMTTCLWSPGGRDWHVLHLMGYRDAKITETILSQQEHLEFV